MSRPILWLAALSCLSACVSIPTLTPAEEEAVAKVLGSPATFEMGKDESAAAWGRAQVFAFKHSRVKTLAEFVVDAGRCPHYTAERLPLGEDRYRITLAVESCHNGPPTPASQQQYDRDLHVFAHFVRTGELVCARDGVSACVSPRETELSFEGPKAGHSPSPMAPGPTVIVPSPAPTLR